MAARHSSQQFLVIGLDVGDGNLIRQWSHEGYLPVFKSLMTGGTSAFLQTTAETLHVSAWPSLYTGTLPGKHGVYYTFQPIPGQQNVRRFGEDQYGQPPVWQLLNGSGKRCIVLDAPYTHPVRNFSGIQIFEWGTWARYWRPMSVPSKLMRQMTTVCGSYPVGFEANQVGLAELNPADLHQRLIQAVHTKAKAVRWLMEYSPWDLLWAVFGETHPAAHYFWPNRHDNRTNGTECSDGFLRDIYQAIDQALGEIIKGLEDNVFLYIISGDGVGSNYGAWHLLPQVLEGLGYLSTSDSNRTDVEASSPKEYKPRDFLKILRDLVPSGARQALSHYLPVTWRDSLMSRWTTANIDWTRTRAFCLPTDLEGCIRLNLIGREPQGTVRPGAEYDLLCSELIAALTQLVNPRTGKAAVRQVVRIDQTFPGQRRDYLPDLVVLWSEEAEISAVRSPTVGLLEAPSPDKRRGTHHPPGFVIAYGPSLQTGYTLTEGHIVDFAPTLLAGFGIPCPPHMDGQVWHEFLTR
jgi:predicted AlkP superfamily phosphohydrolase/phosphomutase